MYDDIKNSPVDEWDDKQPEEGEDQSFVKFGKVYIPTPPDIELLIRETDDSQLKKYYNELTEKHYQVMKDHKKYYDENMAKWGYSIPAPVPTLEMFRNTVFPWGTFLYSWFADDPRMRVAGEDPYYYYISEDTVLLLREFKEDLDNKVPLRLLRGL